MANPQLEDGYTPIANDIVEALMKVNLSSYESRILWFLFRKTYGWGKKTDWLALSQFSKDIGIDRRLVHRAIKGLSSKKMIVIERDDNGKIRYGLQKDFDKWELSSKKMTVIKRDDRVSSKEMTRVSSNQIPTKETITKETITKEKTNRSNDFDRFWSSYPKKVGKQAAMRAYKTHIKRMPPINILVEIISRQKQTDQWQRGYIPNPATWINQGRWDDDISSMNGGNEHGSSRVYAGQRQNVSTTRQMEIDAETERLAQEYYRLKENSAASNP